VAVDVLRAGVVAELEPALAPVAGALFFPEAAHLLSPVEMMRALAADAAAAGVSFQRKAVARLEEGPAAILVRMEDGSSAFDAVVVAAGAWSQQILRTLPVDLPLDTERGYHLMLPTPDKTLTRPVSFPAPGYTLAQMADGIRLTTGVEFAGLDAAPDFRRARHMLAHARRMLAGLAGEPREEWLGFRPSMADSMPVIGRLRRYPRVIVAFGHGHLGVTLGPVTGAAVAALASGKAPAPEIAPFMPSRFGE
jgi:D-amino-acid dehydrogenase